ncbi:LysR family transcriptional regulator [Burkholderia sp. SFA1]|uniref:LysR family transcriptional regulator n=1 Tax=Caballeronia sp. CLC5 TaxID=2906764 RepID=UPI001F179659|nr:LysR family transcriptional regulator [Caballeronia sp. CLC5]MCE4573560.1 LysR family transcriptional regulator [Caballeronia sp. CLC5]BBQ00404.1 LysR family transcriptional regulator [Burkholderia sp. SFA1]
MIDELKSFVTVVEESSLTRAAQKLCVTQSAVSKRIQRLEDVLGAPLLDRNSKPPRATALAHRIHEHAVPLLAAFDRLMNVTREDGDPSGKLRFGLPQGIADIVLFDALTALRDAFPALEVALRSDWSPDLLRLLDAGGLDVAAILTPKGRQPADDYVRQHVATLELAIVQSKRRPLVSNRATLAAIADGGWILNPEGCGYRAALQNAIERAGYALRVKADTHGSEMQLQLIASGLGLGLVPRSVLTHSVWQRRLEVVKVARFAPKLDVWLLHASHIGNFSRAVAHLGDTMKASFKS